MHDFMVFIDHDCAKRDMIRLGHEKSHYEQGSLDGHLSYLRRHLGTPDMWDSYDDLGDAINAAKDQWEHDRGYRYLVTDGEYKVIWEQKAETIPTYEIVVKQTVTQYANVKMLADTLPDADTVLDFVAGVDLEWQDAGEPDKMTVSSITKLED